MVNVTSLSAASTPNALPTPTSAISCAPARPDRTGGATGAVSFSARLLPSALGKIVGMAPFEEDLDREGDQRQAGEKRGEREGGDEIVLIVENLHLQRDRVGKAADMTGNH